VCRIEGYPKNMKNAVFWIWLCPRYKILEFFIKVEVRTGAIMKNFGIL